MGNTHGSMYLPGNEDCSYQVKFGKSAAIDVSKRKVGTTDEGDSYEERTVSYKIHERTSTLCLAKTRRAGDDGDHKFSVSLHDNFQNCSYSFQMVLERAEGGHQHTLSPTLVSMACCNPSKVHLTMHTNTTITARGGITETSFKQYGFPDCVNQRGLVVMKWKKMDLDESPYKVTVAHYFASFGKTDTGLSMIAKIRGVRAEDDNQQGLVVQVEGPVKHPCLALFQMFDEVDRTGCWTPSACSHCANRNQRQNMWQSDSEDNDAGATGTTTCEPMSAGSDQSKSLSSSGVTFGDDNGSLDSASKVVIVE